MTTAGTGTAQLGELGQLRQAVIAFRQLTLLCDTGQLHTELAALPPCELAEVLDLVDEVRRWAADKLEILHEHVTATMTYNDIRVYTDAVAAVVDAEEPLSDTLALLDPQRGAR